MTRFIGIDPGKLTGLVSFYVNDMNDISNVEHYQLDHIGTSSYFERSRDLWKTQGNNGLNDTVVICESFIISVATAKKSQAPYSLETIGAVRYFVETSGLKLNMVSPSVHKSLVTDGILKMAGLYFPGELHSLDAARLSVYWALTRYKLLHWTLQERK